MNLFKMAAILHNYPVKGIEWWFSSRNKQIWTDSLNHNPLSAVYKTDCLLINGISLLNCHLNIQFPRPLHHSEITRALWLVVWQLTVKMWKIIKVKLPKNYGHLRHSCVAQARELISEIIMLIL